MVQRIHRRVPPLLAAALVAVVAAGCTRAASSADPADDTGKVTVACGATEEWCAAMTAGFTRSTGLKADFVRLSSGEALARLEAGKDDPEFDVWHGGPADGYVAASSRGLLEPYVSPNAATIPAAYKDVAGAWTGVYAGALGFCSNTRILAEKGVAAPKSWRDLLAPALRRNVAMAHPSTSGTAYAALWTQVQLDGGADPAFDYLAQLHSNILQYTKSGAAPGQMVARGEIAVGVVFSHDCVALQQEGIKDLTVTFPSEGTGYEVGGVALIKGAGNPVTAARYVDWALTPESQQIGPTVQAFQRPTNPAAAVSPYAFDDRAVKLIEYDVAAAGAQKSVLTKRFDQQIAQAPKS
ncbi:ABC transporter substrate-binding protein [Actinoplanes friuliensis]|uniref:Extracellular solute-binding protein family 1 protein n=1 Tax=Actinoplanes friuliensis DSM 7358 TaxID=1246995 RepID=U5W590_9ACTN|nr:ABC transporter substrate-binding protein [Actinoplanes friuliensis]AGZ43145.1 extracellular solute-binding protein family 1 protein [Actinoplanes friuliensis DSM 7358]